MTKQTEIREGIARIWWEEDNFGWIKDDKSFLWENISEDDRQSMYSDVDKILQFLHSQGVVIKGETRDKDGSLEGCCLARLEPLIEETND